MMYLHCYSVNTDWRESTMFRQSFAQMYLNMRPDARFQNG